MGLMWVSIVVARHKEQSGHPTGFSRHVFEQLRSPMADKGVREVAKHMMSKNRVCHVDVDDPGVIRDINTQAQYKTFVEESKTGR